MVVLAAATFAFSIASKAARAVAVLVAIVADDSTKSKYARSQSPEIMLSTGDPSQSLRVPCMISSVPFHRI